MLKANAAPADMRCHLKAGQQPNAWLHSMKEVRMSTATTIMSIGHSTRTSKEFIQLLKAHRVERLVDVRTVPRSRHNPQFNRSELSPALHSSRLH